MNIFAPLHIISGYSFLKSGLTIPKIAKAIKSNDYFGAGICDNSTLFGVCDFINAMETINKPYIIGIDLCIDNLFFALFVTNESGYKNLLAINTHLQNDTLTFDVVSKHCEGLIIVIETNKGLFLEKFNRQDKIDSSFTHWLHDITKKFDTRCYLGLEITSKKNIDYANKIRQFAKDYTYLCVAFPAIQYLKKEDAIVLKIVNAIDMGKVIKDKKENGQHYFMNEKDYHKIYLEDEIKHTNDIIQSSCFNMKQKRGSMLHYCENSDEALKNMVHSSLKEKGLDDNDKYIQRLDYELNIIFSLNYSNYFLLVQDYVNWAKKNNILVGPGRGSSAGSLVSYLLNITEIDPLKYDLLFERFLNPERKSMPDIDVDFMDTNREDVINYMRKKYGSDKVSTITTFQTIQAKQALRDIGRVYNYAERYITFLSKAIGKNTYSLGQSYKYVPEFKKLVDSDSFFKEIVSLAAKIEGLPRQAGQHAAGVILNNNPINEEIPVVIDFNGNYISQFEASYLEEQGFLKMDFLALRNLTTISRCVDLINDHYPNIKQSKNNIPYDEKEIYDLICSGRTIGLFQIETTTMKRGIKILKPRCFEDVVALLALNRPGPMKYIKNYASRRDGKEKIVYLSNALKDILAPTYGIIVYQEQINQIASKIAGLTPSQADIFRRAISKKDKDKLSSIKSEFIKGCVNNGYSLKESTDVFNDILKFAEYGFNRSHSVVYAVIACRMAYLKAHYTLEFYIALLENNSSNNDTKLNDYIIEMKSMGLTISCPSVNKSDISFVIENNTLLFPLSSISNVNEEMALAIIKERKEGAYQDFYDFVVRLYKYQLTETKLIKLIDAGALDCLYPSRKSMRLGAQRALWYANLTTKENGQLSIGFDLVETPVLSEHVDDPIENLNLEYDTLGIMISNHPLEFKQELLASKNIISINELEENKRAKIAGIIKEIKKIKTKKGTSMSFLKLYDTSSDIEVIIFPNVYEHSFSMLEKNKIIIIEGYLNTKNDEYHFIGEHIEKLEEQE